MADLIDFNDFEAAGGDVSSPMAPLAISGASEKVRGFLNQQVDYVEADTITLVGTGTRALLLPELPVVEVVSVTIDDEIIDPDGYRYADGVLWRRTTTTTSCTTATWPRDVEVVVEYAHGWTDTPADIRLVTARLAVSIAGSNAASLGMNLQTVQETIQDYSYTQSYSSDGSSTASSSYDAELAVIAHRVVRRIPVA